MSCDGEILVSLVEMRPSIYDYNDKEHSNKIVQDKLWEEISKEMKVDGNFNIIIIILILK